jgi:hypothetical protein
MRLNPILLLDDILCTITNGGGVRIGWLASAGSPAARLLMEYGVKTWGYDMASNPDRRYCMVRPHKQSGRLRYCAAQAMLSSKDQTPGRLHPALPGAHR